jgi:putative peptidoglycan lipid II flippase
MKLSSASSHHSTGIQSAIVAFAIFLCRISGFIRQRIFGHYLGISDAADVFNTSFRIPNLLQNLFGEGALSSSFIPVYAKLLSEGKKKEAEAAAGAVISLLALVASLVVCAGVIAAPFLVTVLAPGFEGAKREQTIMLVKILFPGAGLLALSAWCLGVLNSHGKFFLSYTAPIVWNGAIILAIVLAGGKLPYDIAAYAAAGSVAGSALQFLVQLPAVIRCQGVPKLTLKRKVPHVRKIVTNFIPSLMTRGVVQIASFIDAGIASLLGSGAVAVISCAQTIYTLPVSLFGMSISAAELPAMSRANTSNSDFSALRERLNRALSRIAFFVIPSAVALLLLGDTITAALYQTGQFGREGVMFVWATLAGSSFGILASTSGRLYSSAFFALQDTRTPFRFALIRVGIGAPMCYALARIVPGLFHVDPQWGSAGITLASGFAGWIEYLCLKRSFEKRTGAGKTGIPSSVLKKLFPAAVIAGASACAVKYAAAGHLHIHPLISGAVILSIYGCAYFILTYMMNVNESRVIIRRILRMLRVRA